MEKIVNLCSAGDRLPLGRDLWRVRSTYDYGPLGVNMLRNVKNAWWRSMVQLRDDVVGLDAAILSPPRLGASGHLKNSPTARRLPQVSQRWRADKIDGVCPNCGSTEFTESRPST